MNKDERKEFEAFMFGPEGHELHSQINSSQMSANAFAWRVWQAARSTIDAELVEAVQAYFNDYMQDEAEDAECCSEHQHRLAKAVQIALAKHKGKD